MAEPELKVNVKLNDSDYQRGAKNIQKSLGDMERDFKSLGRDIGQLSRSFVLLGGAVTAGIGAAFSAASKDIPQVNQHLKEVSNSFQVMSNSLATAALPSLKSFVDLMNGTAAVVSKFARENQELINQVIKYSAITVIVGTLATAFGSLLKNIAATISILKTMGVVVGVTTTSFVSMTSAILAAAGAVAYLAATFPKFRMAGFVGLGASAGGAASGVSSFINNLKSQISSFKNTFDQGVNNPLQRSVDLVGKFSEGFKSHIKNLGDAISDFGDGVAQSLDKAFGDTIFNAITGKLNGLRSIITSLGNDIARAFSKFAANEIMAGLFGDKEGGSRRGLFSGLGGLFGRGGGPHGGGSQSHLDKAIKKNARTFDDLTDNMKKFARAKDDVIDNLKKFSRQIQASGGSLKGGNAAFAGGTGIGVDITSFEGAIDPVNSLNEALGTTMSFVSGIGQGFNHVSQAIIKMGQTYAITQAVMLAVSAAASAVMVAIGTAAASALAAVWAVPAVLASIATLGGAAVIGTAAVTGAVASAPGIGSAGVSGAAGPGSISFGAGAFGEGVPKLAEGGIVNRPTLALIGEAGPEAVVPLKNGKKSGGVANNVNINIDTAMLNSPSNMRDFVKMLKEELAR